MKNEECKMKERNVILEKSFAFGLRIVKLFLHLKKKGVDRALVSQILRSGTSVGANVEEAIGAQTKKDFISKMNIAYKEIRETIYWIRLLQQSGILDANLRSRLWQKQKN